MRTFLSTLLLAGALAPSAFAQDPQTPAPTADPRYQPADSGSGQYISLAGGFLGSSDYEYDIGLAIEAELESGFGFAGAWGADFGNNWRGEIALSYRNQSFESINGIDADAFGADDVSVLSLDLNAYYDFPTGDSAFRPYVGAGLGVGAIDISDGVLEGSGDALTAQAIAGGSFKVSEKASLFIEGRYQWASVGIDTDGDEDDSEEHLGFGAFGAYAGIRFGF